jgi:hypothetical protein
MVGGVLRRARAFTQTIEPEDPDAATLFGGPRPSAVRVHGATEWPDEAPTVGVPGSGGRVRAFGLRVPRPRAAEVRRSPREAGHRLTSANEPIARAAPLRLVALDETAWSPTPRPAPPPKALRAATVRYLPDPSEEASIGVFGVSLVLVAALMAGCAAGIAAFQALI